jgi:hypothetical protein
MNRVLNCISVACGISDGGFLRNVRSLCGQVPTCLYVDRFLHVPSRNKHPDVKNI